MKRTASFFKNISCNKSNSIFGNALLFYKEWSYVVPTTRFWRNGENIKGSLISPLCTFNILSSRIGTRVIELILNVS